jgi:hypothetical protein
MLGARRGGRAGSDGAYVRAESSCVISGKTVSVSGLRKEGGSKPILEDGRDGIGDVGRESYGARPLGEVGEKLWRRSLAVMLETCPALEGGRGTAYGSTEEPRLACLWRREPRYRSSI